MTKDEAQAVLKDALDQIYEGGCGVQSTVDQFDPILGLGDVEIYEGCARKLVPCRPCSEAGGAERVIEHLEPVCNEARPSMGDPCPHPARNGKHEVYINAKAGLSHCRACGAREPWAAQ